MGNMDLYNAVRAVPETAQKKITGGRLNGKTDINPMWRIKTLTEQFGACGIGWKYEIVKLWLEQGTEQEVSAFVQINLYIKQNDEWSEAIPGIGGSSFTSKEKNGVYVSDECYKMALTDAISVACKSLGIGADVYWDKDVTKYSNPKEEVIEASEKFTCEECGKAITAYKKKDGTTVTAKEVYEKCNHMCTSCYKKAGENQ